MNKLLNIFAILSISFIGADRVNLLSESFEYFIFTPFLFFSLMFFIFLISSKINEINLHWFTYNKIAYQIFILYIFILLFTCLFSQDILVSSKRLILYFFIIIYFLIFFSYYDKKELSSIIYKSSIIGSIIFLIFNIVIVFYWFKYFAFDNTFVNLDPNMISYFIPRLGGYSLDVNRGGVVLLFFTYILYNYNSSNKFVSLLVLINFISLLLTFSRTVFILFIVLFFVYYIMLANLYQKKKIIKYVIFSFVLAILLLLYLNEIKIIKLENLISERFSIDFDLNRFSSSGIHLRLILDGFYIAFNNLKILLFGNGFGTSFLLIKGYYWSGTKYANFHSQYITILVESGIFSMLFMLIYSFIIPLFNKRKNIYMPFVIGLFFYNIFYQLILEPVYWFVLFMYYRVNYKNEK